MLVWAAEEAVIAVQANDTVSGGPADVVAELTQAAQACSSWGDTESSFHTLEVDPRSWIEDFTARIRSKIPPRPSRAHHAALKAQSALEAGNLKLDALTNGSSPEELGAAQELFRTSLAWAKRITEHQSLGDFADSSAVEKIDYALIVAQQANNSSASDLTVSSLKQTSSAISKLMTELQTTPWVGAKFWDDIGSNLEKSLESVSSDWGSPVGEPNSDE